MTTATLEQVLDSAMELPPEQRDMLAEILYRRQIAERRREIAANAEASISLFQSGHLKSQSADELIAELRLSLEDETEFEEDAQ